jgi:hypothetical protein
MMIAEALSRTRTVRLTLLASSICPFLSCATSPTPGSVGIRVQPDVVSLRHEPNAVALDLHVQVRNGSPQPLYLATGLCGVELQRDVEGDWQTVWIPACGLVASPAQRVPAGDSVSTSFTARGFTGTNALPQFDPRMIAGRYRVIMRLGFHTNSAGDINRLLPVDERTSEPFAVN